MDDTSNKDVEYLFEIIKIRRILQERGNTMDKLEEFIQQSINLLKDNDNILREKKDIICKALEKTFEETSVIITGRVKSEKSLREKVIRNNYFDKFEGNPKLLFKGLSDMIGIRVNCLLTREENENYNKLKKECKTIEHEKYKYYIESEKLKNTFFIDLDSKQPEIQKNGKDIYRIDAIYKEEDIEFKVEIQIKSSINSLWGEIDHKLFYKNYEYLLSQDFYSGLMKLIYDNLDSVEKQLELLKDHMENTGDNLDESKEILSRLLYNQYRSECKSIAHDCNIDFRPVCKLLSELYFCIPDKSFDNLNQAIHIIKGINIFPYKENSKFKINSSDFDCYNSDVKELAKITNNIINNENVYWITLINLFSILNSKESYTENLMELSKKLIMLIKNIINQAIIESEVLIESNEIIEDNIIKCSLDYLKSNKNVNIFLSGNLHIIQICIMRIMELNSDIFEKKVNESISTSLVKYIEIVLKLVYEHKLDINYLKVFIEETDFIIVEEYCKSNLDIALDNYENNSNRTMSVEKIIKLLSEGVGENNDK